MKLIDESALYRIQNNLAESRHVRSWYGAAWFNTFMLITIVGIMVSFLYFQYYATREVLHSESTRKNIPPTDFIWNNSIRNNIDL
jgi:hypothetical protein